MLLISLLNRLYNSLRQNKVLFIYVPLAVYWTIIFIATSIPTDKIPQFFKLQDKLEHFAAYFILAILISLTFHFQDKYQFIKKHNFIFTIIVLIVYAAIDELHQMLIPGRIADFYDWMADIIGGLIGLSFAFIIIKIGLNQSVETGI